MALTVDQAVQRLIQGCSRSSAESRVITVTPSQNLGQRGNSIGNGIYFAEKSSTAGRSNRNGGQSRFSNGGGMAANRNSDDHYYLASNNNPPPYSSYHRQNGRGKSNNLPIMNGSNGRAEEMDDLESMQDIFPHQTTGSVVDVQRCLKNIIVSQVNIIKRHQQVLAAKEREIDELRRENNALKNSLRLVEKRLPTENFAQQCDLSEFVRKSISELPKQEDDSGTTVLKSPSQPLDATCEPAVESPDESKKNRERLRKSADVTVVDRVELKQTEDKTISGRLRSGRQRAVLDPLPERKPPSIKRSRSDDETPVRVSRRRSTLKSEKSECSKNSVDVQTPGYRILQFSMGGALEGTENTTDEAFLKRHQKCEIEERRVIRRDRMRQREELLKEKLIRAEHQNRMANQKREKTESESSTIPDIDGLEAIEMCEYLPKTEPTKSPGRVPTPPPAKKPRLRRK